jgi:thiaminase
MNCWLIHDSGRFIDYLLDRPDVQGPWKEYTEHEFVQKLAAGTLPVERFKNYLVQDYLYLVSGFPIILMYSLLQIIDTIF